MPDERNSLSIKDLIAVVPLSGIVLAAVYDWGFFFPADPSLFTLFSWSDHVVFALEPLAGAILIVSAVGWSLSKFTFDAPLKQQRRTRLCCSRGTTGHGQGLPRAAMNSRGERYPRALCG